MGRQSIKIYRAYFKAVLFLSLFFGPNCIYANQKPLFKYKSEIYSETYYDSRFFGATTDTRFYNYLSFFDERVNPYAGAHFMRDLSSGGAPLAIENAVVPTVGLSLKVLKSPYVSVFTERRWVYRTESLVNDWYEDELRFGLVYYHKTMLWDDFFGETYGEWIQIDRVSKRSVFTTWVKLGVDYNPWKFLRVTPHLEAFTRQSGDLGYGPTENEIRSGLKVQLIFPSFTAGVQAQSALASNIKKGAIDGLFFFEWKIR